MPINHLRNGNFSLKKILTSILLLIGAPTITMAAKSALPNIVFIFADDMSYDSVSAFNDKIGNMKTPKLDELVQQGISFTDAHSASAVCTPTRYGLMTGRYCWRTHLKKQVLWTYGMPLIEESQLTIAELLRDEGYQTGLIGKWHLGTGWRNKEGEFVFDGLQKDQKDYASSKADISRLEKTIDFTQAFSGGPRDHGFDYFFGVDLPNMPPYTWLENRKVKYIPSVNKPDTMFGTPGLMKEGWVLEDILPGLTSRACEWIVESAKSDKPFFLFMPLTSPHSPIAPSKRFQGLSGVSLYADFVIQTDWAVGEVLKALEATGEADNTLVIFSTDNGTAPAANFRELASKGVDLHNHFKGHKSRIDEGGHRVPLIMRWPGKINAGSQNDVTVCLNDFLASFAEMTGRELASHEGVDSHSIWPLIAKGKKTLSNHPHLVSHSYWGQYSIRDGDWKLIMPLKKNGVFVLYDLKNDIKETENIAQNHPERVKKMTAILKGYVEDGRSTPGPMQENFESKRRWLGLPW
jgi:arylsulfatase A